MPGVAVLEKEIVSGHWTPSARGVEFAIGKRLSFPRFADGVHDLPRGFHFIATDEKGSIARHRFEEEAFVGFRGISTEFRIITEMHADGAHFQARARNFAVEAEGNAFVGLEAQSECIRIEFLATLRGKED